MKQMFDVLLTQGQRLQKWFKTIKGRPFYAQGANPPAAPTMAPATGASEDTALPTNCKKKRLGGWKSKKKRRWKLEKTILK